MNIEDVKFSEEEYELEFASNFTLANDIRGTLWYPRDERPITTNLLREVHDSKIPSILDCGGLSVAVCYALYKIYPTIHTYEFHQSLPRVMRFKVRIPESKAKHIRWELVTGHEKLEKELKALAQMPDSNFSNYVSARIENCTRRLSEIEIRNRQKEQRNISGPSYFAPEQVYTEADGKGFLGKGASAVVLKAYHHEMGVLAVKCMENHLPQNEEKCRKRFDKESAMLFKLSHKNIVGFLGITGWNGAFGLMMEYLPGGNLSQLCRKRKYGGSLQFPWPLRLRVVKDISNGLAYLHNAKIVHGDLKPANILLDCRMHAKIADFGGANIAASSGSTSSSKCNLGANAAHQFTLIYAAPEFLNNIFTQRRKTPEDVYSFAIIIYEVLVRQRACDNMRMDNISAFKDSIKKGQRPNLDLVNKVKAKHQSSNDLKIVKFMEEIMISSWDGQPKRRPTIENIDEQTNTFWKFQNEDSVFLMGKELYFELRKPSWNQMESKWVKLNQLSPPEFTLKASNQHKNSFVLEPETQPKSENIPKPKQTPVSQPTSYTPSKENSPDAVHEANERKESSAKCKSFFDCSTTTTQFDHDMEMDMKDMLQSFTLAEDADALWLGKDYEKASESFSQLLHLKNTSSQHSLTRLKIAHCKYAVGKTTDGDKEMTTALESLNPKRSSSFITNARDANSMLQVAKVYYETHQQSRGLLITKQAAAIFASLGNTKTKIDGLDNCARLIKKKHSQSLTSNSRVVSVCKYIYGVIEPISSAEPLLAGNAIHSIAYFLDEITEYPLAIKYYEAGMRIVENMYGDEAKRMHFYTNSIHNLAVAYMNCGQYDKADELFKQALTLDKAATDYGSKEDHQKSIAQTERLIKKNERFLTSIK